MTPEEKLSRSLFCQFSTGIHNGTLTAANGSRMVGPVGRRQARERCRNAGLGDVGNLNTMGYEWEKSIEIWYFNGMLDIVKWDMNEIQWDLFGY